MPENNQQDQSQNQADGQMQSQNQAQPQTQSIIDEKKFHTLDPKKKPVYTAIGAVAVFVVLPALLYPYYTVALNRPAQNHREKVFKIDRGEGASAISSRLYAEDLINSKALFDIYVVLNNLQSNLQAGVYKIPAGTSVKNLVALFGRGVDDTRITFLEGWRVEEIAQEASGKLDNIGYDKFLDLAKDYEGRLFPDTYDFNSDVDEKKLVDAMRANFKTKTADVLTAENLAKVGLSEDQALILASIVEREVHGAEDQALVAGILIKRFKEGGLVGADATTQYVVAPKTEGGQKVWWPKLLTAEDLASASPYNTRKVAGLPPMPICSPGLQAIKAVISPTESKFYYYLTDSKGTTHYAITLDEHNRNIGKYL